MRAEVTAFEWPDLEREGINPSQLRSTLLVLIARPIGEQGG